jgi:hypothetical protein
MFRNKAFAVRVFEDTGHPLSRHEEILWELGEPVKESLFIS